MTENMEPMEVLAAAQESARTATAAQVAAVAAQETAETAATTAQQFAQAATGSAANSAADATAARSDAETAQRAAAASRNAAQDAEAAAATAAESAQAAVSDANRAANRAQSAERAATAAASAAEGAEAAATRAANALERAGQGVEAAQTAAADAQQAATEACAAAQASAREMATFMAGISEEREEMQALLHEIEDAATRPVGIATFAAPTPAVYSGSSAQSAPTPTDEDKEAVYAIEALGIVKLGRQGENETQEVLIDATAWEDDNMEGAAYVITATRPGEQQAYLPEINAEDGLITWNVKAQDTALKGYGYAQITAVLGEKIRKSPIFKTRVEGSLEEATGEPVTPPDWVQEVLDAAAVVARAAAAAQSAEAATAQANAAAAAANEVALQVDNLAQEVRRIDWKTGVKKYIIRWDKTNRRCTRMGDAAEITTDYTHFAHRGSVDPNYSNPFDNIYPWANRKLCKVDPELYAAIYDAGGKIENAITMWEDDPGFALGDSVPGMDMVYTPTFWRTQWEEDGYVYIGVADGEVQGWTKRPATIGARYFAHEMEGGGLGSLAGTIARRNIAVSALQTKAAAQRMTLDDIFTWTDDTVLMAVEYATLNTQEAVGNGVSDLYRESEDHPLANVTEGNIITLPAAMKAHCIHGAVLGIGTSKGGEQVAVRAVESVVNNADPAYVDVTLLGAPVTVTTEHFVCIHGKMNTADAEIGSKSGYIGTNGKSMAYYRGRVAHANYFRYVLGAYREKNTNHIWLARSRAEAAAVNDLDTARHIDTGCELPETGGYIGSLHLIAAVPLAPFAATTAGGNSTDPVGDYVYMPERTTVNTILLAGGNAHSGADAGRFYGYWLNASGYSGWHYAALLFLISPEGD